MADVIPTGTETVTIDPTDMIGATVPRRYILQRSFASYNLGSVYSAMTGILTAIETTAVSECASVIVMTGTTAAAALIAMKDVARPSAVNKKAP